MWVSKEPKGHCPLHRDTELIEKPAFEKDGKFYASALVCPLLRDHYVEERGGDPREEWHYRKVIGY